MRRSKGNRPSAQGTPLQQIRGTEAALKFQAFLRSPLYIVSLGLLTVISNLLGLDILLYSLFVLVMIGVCLFGDDLLPLMPMAVLCYIAPSAHNNPGHADNTGSIFYPGNGGIYLLILAAALLAAMVFRLVTDPDFGGAKFLKADRKLLKGMLLLGGAYLLSGIGMEGYLDIAGKNLLFAFLQMVAITALYYLFSGGIKWDRAPKDYLAWIGMVAGFVIIPQLLENYLSGRIFMEGTGTMDRELIYTGWGMHNNMGGMMAMMLPFCFYLAEHKKPAWVYHGSATVLFGGVILSCSRTAMIVAAAIYCFCAFTLLKGNADRKAAVRVYMVAAAVVLAVVVVFFHKLLDIFALFFEELFIMSERDNLLSFGIKQFLHDPIFGGSFFPQGEYVPWDWSTAEAFTSFFPPRWHNTLVQIGASCGVVGLAAYAFHRVQTVKLLTKTTAPEKHYVAMYMGVLLVCSLLDCHFFNLGPVLFYSMALAFAEHIDE